MSEDMKADVYFNLHKRVWSLRDRTSGRVEAHARVVYSAFPVRMVVREAGRRRVLETKQKNVHAFARFDTCGHSDDVASWLAFAETLDKVALSYNPYRGGTFYAKPSGAPVLRSGFLLMVAPIEGPPMVWGNPLH